MEPGLAGEGGRGEVEVEERGSSVVRDERQKKRKKRFGDGGGETRETGLYQFLPTALNLVSGGFLGGGKLDPSFEFLPFGT